MNHRSSIAHPQGPRLAPLAACVLGILAGAFGAGATTLQSRDPFVQARPSELPVTSCADDGNSGTLRSVVAAAATGDTVDLAQATIRTSGSPNTTPSFPVRIT